ncbi:SPOR domain-containing protein [Ramlibacter sp. AW1]|uniref:SPOR domain-containing protein n=1 Tax=Ramlibacter aurantiacus TaxID=2801330 RepID=A0A936ZT97_9BURK|nr:SPOR domain-containing protein [Ramlibacter aurantiacus]MBL0420209.1 SPOR domain-containing protein [Ramlibacter aurantiacus]
MAFFKFRKGERESVARPAAPSESVEAMRKRARQRLIGAGVLVLAGVIGFPLLFDTQPRPVAVDIPIEIPDRHKSAPVSQAPPTVPVPPAAATAAAPPASAPTTAAPAAVAPAPAASAVAPAAPPAPAALAAPPSPARSEARAEPQRQAPDEAARAKALLEGREPAVTAAAADGRYVVQVGAFAEAGKAREVRQRLERAGVKTYVHVAETKDGPRIRVRVGPFTSRTEADRAAQKIKGLDLPAAILTL